MFNPYNSLFALTPIFIFVVLVIILVFMLLVFTKGLAQWRHNNAQPVLTVLAKVTAKRTQVSRNMHNTGDSGLNHLHSHTSYYITFEVESGDRLEFAVQGMDYGQLVENDFGKLTFQGTRFLGFSRNLSQY